MKQQRNFWVQIGPLLSLHMIFSPLSTVGAWWWGRGRVVLQSTRGTGVYWGVAATGAKTNAYELCGRTGERKRKHRARTNGHSLLRNCRSNCLTCWCNVIVVFSSIAWLQWQIDGWRNRKYSLPRIGILLNSPWVQFKEQPSLRWVFFYFTWIFTESKKHIPGYWWVTFLNPIYILPQSRLS